MDIKHVLDGIDAGITICDTSLTITYMNRKATSVFSPDGTSLTGTSLIPCHKPSSVEKIRTILESGIPNVYTITKQGRKKLIWQAPVRDDSGMIIGVAELSLPLPDAMPHYDRDREQTQQ
ncbi:MAG: PAS domain-containing protein [Rectinemataceae bacterium]